MYQVEAYTKVLVDRLSINTPLDEPTITQLLVTYCTVIVRNLIRLLKGYLVYYELIPVATKNICSYHCPLSLRRLIFNLIHAISVAR